MIPHRSQDPGGPMASCSCADPRIIHCVFLTCSDADFRFANILLRYPRNRFHRAETAEEADFLLTVTEATVFLSDTFFFGGYWEDSLRMCASFHPSVATFVVANPALRDYLWQASELGAAGILWKPLDISETRKLIQLAHEAAVLRRRKAQETRLKMFSK
jgi:DNA-binding NtrC family response regulator